MVSIFTTQSTFLKTSLTSNTIFLMAKDKEMNLSSSACLLQSKQPVKGNFSPRHKFVLGSLGGVIAVPTSAWHRELRRDDITFTKDQQESMDVVARAG